MKHTISRIIRILFKTIPYRVYMYFLWRKHKNSSYAAYYAAAMKRRTKLDPKTAIGGKWEFMGKHQVDLQKLNGLLPNHTLLDLGCGSLRGGLHFIPYLHSGNYTGIDISKEILDAGNIFLKEKQLEGKKPTLLLVKNLQFNELPGKTFDRMNAQSVLSHMPVEDIEELFANLHKVLKPTGVFIATFFEDDTYHPRAQMLNFHYPLQMLVDLGEKYGLNIIKIQDKGYKNRKQKVMKITWKDQTVTTS